MSKHSTLNQEFFKTWSLEMAYVLGYFAADGSMIQNKRGGYYIEFTTTDRILLVHLKRITGASQKIELRTQRNKIWKPQYRLQIGSQKWFKDLLDLGFITDKSKTLCFPSVPKAYLADFIRGYFDGDGCVYFNFLKYADRSYKRWILQTLFTSGSLNFLTQLHHILKENGIRGGSICCKERGHELKFSHHDSLALYRLMYHTAPIAGLYLPRKREKLEQAIKVLKLDTMRA